MVVAGGIDPSGGAGLLRDVATAAACGARAHAVGTAWTEQGDRVHRVEPRGDGCRVAIDLHAGRFERALAATYGPVIQIMLDRLARTANA